MSLPKQVYVTQYALTKGILLCATNAEWNKRPSCYHIYVDWPRGANGVAPMNRDECHETLEQAQTYCREVLIERKRKSLLKQLAKLDKFDPTKVKEVGT